MHDGAADGGVARAGALFAARRDELGISQRELAKMKVISAPALIAFEKGRSWPRDKTRAKLEQVVKWPPGTLAKLSAGAQAPGEDAKEVPRDESADLLSGAVLMAARPVLGEIDQLPEAEDPMFSDRVRETLASIRHLESLTAKAVRSSQGSPEMLKLLREIRRRYDDLMARAAAAPGATLAQRLYTARHDAALSVEEAAGALNVDPELLLAAEREEPVSEDLRVRIEALITDLTG